MKARVVYESILGNTRQVAEAIGQGLAGRFEVEVVEVGQAASEAGGADLLVVGGPTHVWSMTRPSTRKAGRAQAEEQHIKPASTGIGVREWLSALPPASGTTSVAAFDTAAGSFGIVGGGSAARKEATVLTRKGYRLIAEPEQFLITMTEDKRTVLKDGELDRARQWGERLAGAM